MFASCVNGLIALRSIKIYKPQSVVMTIPTLSELSTVEQQWLRVAEALYSLAVDHWTEQQLILSSEVLMVINKAAQSINPTL